MDYKYGYNGPERFRPLSPWAYFGYTLLFAIPVIGLVCMDQMMVCLIVFSLSDTNINRRSFARSFFCGLVLSVIIGLVMGLLGVLPALWSAVQSALPTL